MGSRRGFTLVELLVVIAIISILGGMIMAAVHHSRQQSYKAECWNNLKQISYGLTMYCDDNRGESARGEAFPERLTYLFSRKYITNPDVFLCRKDGARGTTGSRSDGKYSETYEKGDRPDEVPCSYFYEMPAVECSWELDSVNKAGVWGPPTPANPTGAPTADHDLNGDGTATWAEVKYCQMTYGDTFSHLPEYTTKTGGKTNYPPTKFPVVRCSWHARTPNDTDSAAYINLAYMGNVFYSGSQWEYAVTGTSP